MFSLIDTIFSHFHLYIIKKKPREEAVFLYFSSFSYFSWNFKSPDLRHTSLQEMFSFTEGVLTVKLD